MSLVNVMNEETDCIQAIFMSFITRKSPDCVFLFFEGKDDFKYYCPRVQSAIGNIKYEKFDCNGKENVIKLHRMIKEQTSTNLNIIKMFFVDADFDDNKNVDKDIYVTPTYSIENLYFTDIAIENMLKGEMGLSDHYDEDKKDFDTGFEYITRFRDNLISEMLYGNACYSLQIKKAYKLGMEKPNLSTIKKYEDIINISNIADIRSKIKGYIEITEDEVKEECKRMMDDPVNILRGKYFIEKMPTSINKICQESNKKIECSDRMFVKKRKMRLNTSMATLISDLSNYAETPQCLIKYINNKTNLAI